MKTAAIFAALSVVFLVFSKPALADYQQAYSDYVYKYSLYRDSYNAYQISKSSYLTYRTLTAQSDGINKLRAVLKSRDAVMTSYYSLLQEKLNATPNIPNDAKTTFYAIKQSESDWLVGHQVKIDAAASLDDLNSVSGEFEGRYPQMDTESKQTIGNILLAKEGTLRTRFDDLTASFSAKLVDVRISGEDTTVMDRELITTKSKLDLYQSRYDQSRLVFFPTGNYFQTINLFQGQQNLTETNQYLREAETFLLEIIRTITG